MSHQPRRSPNQNPGKPSRVTGGKRETGSSQEVSCPFRSLRERETLRLRLVLSLVHVLLEVLRPGSARQVGRGLGVGGSLFLDSELLVGGLRALVQVLRTVRARQVGGGLR